MSDFQSRYRKIAALAAVAGALVGWVNGGVLCAYAVGLVVGLLWYPYTFLGWAYTPLAMLNAQRRQTVKAIAFNKSNQNGLHLAADLYFGILRQGAAALAGFFVLYFLAPYFGMSVWVGLSPTQTVVFGVIVLALWYGPVLVLSRRRR